MTDYAIYIIIGVLIILLLSTLGATRAQVVSTYKKYDKKPCEMGITAGQFIMASKKYLGMFELRVARTERMLGDAYDLRSRTLILSDDVLESNSVAAISVSAHELGHAMQHNDEYVGLQISYILTIITKFLLEFIVPIILAGVIMLIFGNANTGLIFLYSAATIFFSSILIKLVLIPVEFNASKRALKYLKDNNVLTKKELVYSKRILKLAAFTYVYSFFSAIFLPFRIIRKLILGF